MTIPDFTTLRAGGPGCPSDWRVEAFVAGEPPGDGEVAAHIAGCDACAARVATYRRGFEAFPGVDERALWAGALRRARPEPRRAWWHLAWLGPLVAAALAVVVWPRDAEEPLRGGAPEGVRNKGGLGLHVHRWAPSGAVEVVSGAPFRAGDRLRFVVDLPIQGHVAVLGVEPGGRLYTAWPTGQDTPTALGPAERLALPGAVTLDGTVGPELLVLAHCPEAGDAARCTSRGPANAPECPAGCSLTTFLLQKTR